MTDCEEALGGIIHSTETPSNVAGFIVVPRGNNNIFEPAPANAQSLGIDEIEFIRAENIFVNALNA